MAPKILGISAYYHDSAAALVANGDIVAAAQEERFTRVKHDSAFPENAVAYCLREAGITTADLDYVVFYDKPYLKFERLLETYLACAPHGLSSFLKAMPQWLKHKLHLPREIRNGLGGKLKRNVVFTRHHESHAASAFFPSPFDEAAILTIDGVGEWDTSTIGHGRGNRVELLETLPFPHSLGLLYSAFTYFCGFRVNSGEYKLMGLAPYGEPVHAQAILDHLLDLKEDGSFRMNLRHFDYAAGLRMTSRRFDDLFGGPPRKPEAPITRREIDLAASVQAVTEEIVLRMARTARARTGCRNLCLAGGVALNCVANGKLLRSGLFDDIWIQPAAGDAGGALGGALFVHHHLLDGARETDGSGDRMKGAYLGPAYSGDEVRTLLEREGLPYRSFDDDGDLTGHVADGIAAGKVTGWFCGRMEFGPRALGARSILGDPRDPGMQSRMNLQIKFRESFRPFAPSVLAHRAGEAFDLDRPSPYMLLVTGLREERRRVLDASEQAVLDDPDLCKRVNLPRSDLPAITHVDYSARVQTVDGIHNPRYHALLEAFAARTGCPVLINTSFNIRGEPIVESPADALRCFLGTDMDRLVLENCVLDKTAIPLDRQLKRNAYTQAFAPD